MSDKWPTGSTERDVPPPRYANDKGWSKERAKKEEEIGIIVDQDRSAKREHSKETLDSLRSLIEETAEAIRNNPETNAGMTWIEQSTLVQGLLYEWYLATKDSI